MNSFAILDEWNWNSLQMTNAAKGIRNNFLSEITFILAPKSPMSKKNSWRISILSDDIIIIMLLWNSDSPIFPDF